MSRTDRGDGDDAGQRPVWDLLEVLERGPEGYPRYVALYPGESLQNRVAILMAGLSLGPEVAGVLREHLSRRDSREKWALAAGLGEMGHPEVEGYFARVLRERAGEGPAAVALGALGRIRGPKSFPLVAEALKHDPLLEAACTALGSYGTPEAAATLLQKADTLPALRALAEMGAAAAADQFAAALDREPPWPEVGALGIGRSGRRDLSPRLLPLIESKDEPTRVAAFTAYADLGAPEGVAPLLRAVPHDPPPWMIAALGNVDDGAVRKRLLELLSSEGSPGLMGRLLFWKRKSAAIEPGLIYRALRRATEPEVVEALAPRIAAETETQALRDLLDIAGVPASPAARSAVHAVWRQSRDPTFRYLAARVLLQSPDPAFLGEAFDCLSLPGFRPDEAASPLWDETHALTVYAQDNNACLVVNALLDSGLVDLEELRQSLLSRFAARTFPPDAPATETLASPADRSAAAFLEALPSATPSIRAPVCRLLNLLAQLDNHGESVLDLLLCTTGVHLGGVQRTLFRSLPAAVGLLLKGKDDRYLPELDRVAQRVPETGPLRLPLLELLDRARRTLMAECHDMAIYGEGMPRGDMVLVEQLRGG